MFKFLSRLFPSKSQKDIKEIFPYVAEINSLYGELQGLSDDELRQKTQEFKELIQQNTQELEGKITELQEKLKQDLSHQERQDVYAELGDLDKELQDVTEATLSEILPQAFAIVKETCRRLCGREWTAAGTRIKWDMIPFDVQLIGGIVLHSGKISEMATGEGKTLVATLPTLP